MKRARIALAVVAAQLPGLVSIFVVFSASPDYLLTLTVSLVFALLHFLSASMFIRTSPRWYGLLVAPVSAGVAAALVVNANRFVSVFSKALLGLASCGGSI